MFLVRRDARLKMLYQSNRFHIKPSQEWASQYEVQVFLKPLIVRSGPKGEWV